jgi:metallo-beta-lactamase class B
MTRNLILIFAGIFLLSGTSSTLAEKKLEITHLTGDFYVYTTYNYYKGNRIPANGLYVVTGAGVVIIDSPWDTTQFQPLLDTIQARHNKKAVMCLATHFHEDRTGGLEYYRSKGIATYTTKRTDALSQLKGMKRAEFLVENDTLFRVGEHTFEILYPGPGHAPDNIVVWFEKERILYGGCLIKSVDDHTLGNLGDADTKAYASTVEKVIRKCPRPSHVIPGHNGWIDKRSTEHTLEMARKLTN